MVLLLFLPALGKSKSTDTKEKKSVDVFKTVFKTQDSKKQSCQLISRLPSGENKKLDQN